VTRAEVESAIESPDRILYSDQTGLPIACAWQGDRWLYCVYVAHAADDVTPITAFYVAE
jgi:hypothetical protein